MRRFLLLATFGLMAISAPFCGAASVYAQALPEDAKPDSIKPGSATPGDTKPDNATPDSAKPGAAKTSSASGGALDVSADQSLEWYEDQHMYVARGHAKAIRGDLTVEADVLTAHERDKPEAGKDQAAATPKPSSQPPSQPKVKDKSKEGGTGDIDRMTADGNVVVTKPKQKVYGQHAVYDLDQSIMVVTGDNLKYETEKETVTARDSLEYWEAKKIAVARGNAVADRGDRHVKGDVLTAEFRDGPDGAQELWKMTAIGNVTVITKGDVSRGNQAVYDVDRDIAVLKGDVRITRANGMQLSGDLGEVNFKTNESRLLNEGKGRVRALLPAKSSPDKPQKVSAKSKTGSNMDSDKGDTP